jgi:hypothetical protein
VSEDQVARIQALTQQGTRGGGRQRGTRPAGPVAQRRRTWQGPVEPTPGLRNPSRGQGPRRSAPSTHKQPAPKKSQRASKQRKTLKRTRRSPSVSSADDQSEHEEVLINLFQCSNQYNEIFYISGLAWPLYAEES